MTGQSAPPPFFGAPRGGTRSLGETEAVPAWLELVCAETRSEARRQPNPSALPPPGAGGSHFPPSLHKRGARESVREDWRTPGLKTLHYVSQKRILSNQSISHSVIKG